MINWKEKAGQLNDEMIICIIAETCQNIYEVNKEFMNEVDINMVCQKTYEYLKNYEDTGIHELGFIITSILNLIEEKFGDFDKISIDDIAEEVSCMTYYCP